MFNLADYQTVAERLEQFWKENPDGRIDTELIEAVGNRFIVKASVYRTEVDAHAWATGLAFEIISDRGVNSTSALENAESSAIGRALANAGYSPKGEPAKRASREEMQKVQNNHPKTFAEKLESKITVEVPADPWTVKAIDESAPAADAVALVKDVLGGVTQKDIPKCKCNREMRWADGVSKQGKPWGHFKCTNVPARKCQEPIWYNLGPDGTWQPREQWA